MESVLLSVGPSVSAGGAGNPVLAKFFVNGYADTGAFDYSLQPGSVTPLTVTAVYPWSEFPSLSGPIAMKFTIYPFPVSGAIPSWLHVSLLPSLVTMAKGTNSSTVVQITLDKILEPGQAGSFLLAADYTDPASGIGVTFRILINIIVGSQVSLTQTSSTAAIAGTAPPLQVQQLPISGVATISLVIALTTVVFLFLRRR